MGGWGGGRSDMRKGERYVCHHVIPLNMTVLIN